MKNYFKNLGRSIMMFLIAFDKLVNVVFAPLLNLIPGIEYKFGYWRDTLSEVFGRNQQHCKICGMMCVVLGWVDRKHCSKSIVED